MRVAFNAAESDRSDLIGNFFVGGRNIQSEFLPAATWGTSLGFGNSIFYCIWLGYSVGLFAIILNATWALGLIALAALAPQLVIPTGKYTLHGFLGSVYGGGLRVVAAIISLTGLILNLGFEIWYGAKFLGYAIELQTTTLFVVLFAVFIAMYCGIGGYRANAATDRYQTVFVSLALLVFLLYAFKYSDTKIPTLSAEAIQSLGDWSKVSSWPFAISMILFGFYHLVDMTNWQNFSAQDLHDENGEIDPDKLRSVQKALISAAVRVFFFPIVIGIFIGWSFRALEGIDQGNIISTIIDSSLEGFNRFPMGEYVRAFLLGLITFCLLSGSCSAADSWLVACAQTLSWDIFDHKILSLHEFNSKSIPIEHHEAMIQKARAMLFIIGIGGSLIILYFDSVWPRIFDLQFIMYGAALSMFPAVIFALTKKEGEEMPSWLKIGITTSVYVGYIGTMGLFVYSLFYQIDLYSAGPSLAFIVPWIVLVLATIMKWIFKITHNTGRIKRKAV